jgi:hypothetical protein
MGGYGLMINQELIVIKQLPVIEEKLKQLSEDISGKVESAKALVCTEENVKTIKQVRANLNKEFIQVENQRKAVKEQILEPYMKFEKIYKEYISDKYKSADEDLKIKINTVENELKVQKEQEIKNYFEELKTANNIDFVTYGQAKINVTLTASKKSLKEQVDSFINKILDDLKLIETQDNKAEILVEYKKDLNVSRAITEVVNRKEELLKIQQQQIDRNLQEEKNRIQENLNNLASDNTDNQIQQEVQTQEKIYKITFTVTGTAVRLKQLKDYMLREGYQYE